MSRACLAVCALIALTACARRGPAAPRRIHVELPRANGLSGLDVDHERSLLWTIPERERILVGLAEEGVSEVLAIEGVGRGIDLEAVAVLGQGRFAFGTESNGLPRGEGDGIVLAERRGDALVATGTIPLPPSLWELGPVSNQGVEGLCAAGDHLVAALETVGGGGRVRFAPVAVRELAPDAAWVSFRLRLTTATGKIAALDCRPGDGGRLDVVAVERHFGVARVVAFEVPIEGPGGELAPVVVLDLDAFAARTRLNLEGIARRGDDLVFAVDNQYKGELSGPNEIVVVRGAAR